MPVRTKSQSQSEACQVALPVWPDVTEVQHLILSLLCLGHKVRGLGFSMMWCRISLARLTNILALMGFGF